MARMGHSTRDDRAPGRAERGRRRALVRAAVVGLLGFACLASALVGCRERGHGAMPPPELFAEPVAPVRGATLADPAAQPGGGAATGATASAAIVAVDADAGAAVAQPAQRTPPAEAAAPVSDDPSCPGPDEDVARCPRLAAAPAASATIGQVLIGWTGSLPDPRIERDPEAAEQLARDVLHQARLPGADLFALAAAHSDDSSDGLYVIDAQSAGRYVGPLVERARRLGIGQVDLVRSRFGWHVLQRLSEGTHAPQRRPVDLCAGPCPLATERPSACPRDGSASAPEVEVDTLWIGWRGSPGAGRRERARDEARALAVELCHAAREEGASFEAVRARHPEDAGDGRRVVRTDSELATPYLRMALALPLDAVAVVETVHGFHVLHRRR